MITNIPLQLQLLVSKNNYVLAYHLKIYCKKFKYIMPNIKVRQIAGKIAPSMVTNSAIVAGLLCLELYKTVVIDDKMRQCGEKPTQCVAISSLRNSNINLANPRFVFYTPCAAQREKVTKLK